MCVYIIYVHQINVSYRIHAKYARSEADGRFAGNILVAVGAATVAVVRVVVALRLVVDQAQTIIVVVAARRRKACSLRRVAPIKCLINAQRICAAFNVVPSAVQRLYPSPSLSLLLFLSPMQLRLPVACCTNCNFLCRPRLG